MTIMTMMMIIIDSVSWKFCTLAYNFTTFITHRLYPGITYRIVKIF